MRRIIAAVAFLVGLLPAIAAAQAPPPVAALPDAERRTSYPISGTTCSCSVGFQLYATGVDVDAWLEVWIAGVRYLSTDPTHGWVISSATGPLASIARPITNGVLTFNQVQTGVVQIVSAERPRRLSQFAENRGVAARDLNLAFTDIVATQRDTWDKTNDVTGRSLIGLPGETITPLPSATARASSILGFDGSGNPVAISPSIGTGTVIGPSSSVDGHVAVFSGITGQMIKDGGPSVGTMTSVIQGNGLSFTTTPCITSCTISLSNTPTLGVSGASIGTINLAGNTSGTALITPQAAAGTPTLTLPNTSGTFAVGASGNLALNATTGALTMTASPTFATSATTPLIAGGTGAASNLTVESTSGAGTTDFIDFLTGSQVRRARISTGGSVLVGSTTAAFTNALLDVNYNSTAAVAPQGGLSHIRVTAPDGGFPAFTGESFGAGNSFFTMRAASGTLASPTALTAGHNLGTIALSGYNGSTYNQSVALQATTINQMSGSDGSGFLDVLTTPAGATVASVGTRHQGSGGVSIGTTVDPGLGQLLAKNAISSGIAGSSLGSVILGGNTSGTVTLQPQAAAGSWVWTLPNTAGSNGQLLQTDGAGNSSWITASGTGTVTSVVAGTGLTGGTITTAGTIALGSGNRVLLATLTASGSTSLADTTSLTGTYNRYELLFENIVPATNAVICRLRVNVAGVQTTGYLASTLVGATVSSAIGTETTYIPCSRRDSGTLSNTAANGGLSGVVSIENPSNATRNKFFRGDLIQWDTGTSNVTGVIGYGTWNTNQNAITGFEVTMSAGNITSGTIKVIGIIN